MPRNRRFATVEKSYITDIERERCKKVAAAYAELYELENILVLDVGRYGFVKLQYYTPEYGFNLSYETVRNYLNARFYWDPNENILRYTTANDLISVNAESSDYTVNKDTQSFGS